MGSTAEAVKYLYCRAEQRDGVVGAALVSWLPCIQDWMHVGVLPNCWDVYSDNWEVEELHQDGKAVLIELAEVEHGHWAEEEPTFLMAALTPLSSNGMYEGSTRSCRWMSLISLLHECPVVFGRTGSKLSVEGLCNVQSPSGWSGYFPWRRLECQMRNISVVPPWSVSTARTFAGCRSSSGNL